MSHMQSQCWICPYCFDDKHHEPVAECERWRMAQAVNRFKAQVKEGREARRADEKARKAECQGDGWRREYVSENIQRLQAERKAAELEAEVECEERRFIQAHEQIHEMSQQLAQAQAEAAGMREALLQTQHLARQHDGGFGPKHPPRGVRADEFLAVIDTALAALSQPSAETEQQGNNDE
jgi:hypothetical protein